MIKVQHLLSAEKCKSKLHQDSFLPQSEWPSLRKQTVTNASQDKRKRSPYALLPG
jgi:hypothetical protein